MKLSSAIPRLRASFDIQDMRGDSSGLEDLFWPIDREERIRFMQVFIRFMQDFFRSEAHEDVYLIRLLHNNFSLQLATIFQAQLLKVRCAGMDVAIPQHATAWRMLFYQEEVPAHQLRYIRGGLVKPPMLKRWLRACKPAFASNGLHPRPIELVPFSRGIVATGGGPVIFEHARRTDEPVYLCPVYEWFSTPTAADLVRFPLRPADAALLDRFCSGIEALFSAHGAPIEAQVSAWLRDWFKGMTPWVRFYYERLCGRTDRLPQRLWTGSCGIIWNRILGYAVRQHGGHVSVHDHALGANASRDAITYFVEGQDCDELVTFTPAIAEMLNEAKLNQGFSADYARVVAINELGRPSGKNMQVVRRATRRPQVPPRKVLFVQAAFLADMGEFNPLMPDVVAADWQLRLLSWLKAQGYDVLVKPHPGSKSRMPQRIYEQLGVQVLSGRFEDVYDQADILIYDYTLTTAFGAGLRTDLPVVLIDFGYSNLPDEYRLDLERRVAVLSGWFDHDNRACVDWSKVGPALRAAVELKDATYCEKVVGDFFY